LIFSGIKTNKSNVFCIFAAKIQNNDMSNKGRIEYIDAMRGLTMILVVYSHICLFCLGDMLLGVNDTFIVIITIALIVLLES